MRRPGNDRTPPDLAHAPAPVILTDLNLRVFTPMFGGGVEPGHLDHGNLIRPSAIRGHLRFWWRACNAARFTSLADLHKEERALWGSAAKRDDSGTGPAVIGVRVTVLGKGTSFAQEDGPRYVLFPFVENDEAGGVGISFRLRLTIAPHAGRRADWPDPERCGEAAEQALWAWIAFGGVGARTRRGCGTLFCTGNGAGNGDGLSADRLGEHRLDAALFRPSGDLETWLRTGLHDPSHVASPDDGDMKSVPSLTGCRIAVGSTARQPITAWKSAVETMQKFLQGEGVGRNPGARNRPGLSRWPEVGAARGLFNASNIGSSGHQYKKLDRDEVTGAEFPRADLGLPRLLKLQDTPRIEATVEGAGEKAARMASPIILKALPIDADHAVPVALLLQAPHVWDANVPGVQISIEHGSAKKLNTRPMAEVTPDWPFKESPPRNVTDPGVSSARDAFMNYVASLPDWEERP